MHVSDVLGLNLRWQYNVENGNGINVFSFRICLFVTNMMYLPVRPTSSTLVSSTKHERISFARKSFFSTS